jgi:hypothetical protein
MSVFKCMPFASRQKGRDPLGGRGPQIVYSILTAAHKREFHNIDVEINLSA